MRLRWGTRILAAVVCSGLLFGAFSVVRAGFLPPLTIPPSRTPSPRLLPDEPPVSPAHIRIWAYRWPAPVNGPEAGLGQVIGEFRASHPGVTVDLVILGYQACTSELTRALLSGDPPDIFLPPPGGLAVYDEVLQLDLRPFLARHEIESYLPQAISGCSRGARLLALPRWVEGRAWIANAGALRSVGFDPGKTMSGWTWREFENLCEQLKAKRFVPAMVDPSSPDLMTDLGYEPPGEPQPPGRSPPPPTDTGPPRVLSSAPAELARSLVRRGLARAQIVGGAEWRTLDALAGGNVGFAAGLSPILASEIVARHSRDSFSPVLMPVPTSGLLRGHPVRTGGIIVFRQQQYKGGQHTRIVVNLAKALSTAPWDGALPVLLTPAYRPNLGDWTEAHGWNAVVALASVQRGSPQPLYDSAELRLKQLAREKARIELKRGFSRLQ